MKGDNLYKRLSLRPGREAASHQDELLLLTFQYGLSLVSPTLLRRRGPWDQADCNQCLEETAPGMQSCLNWGEHPYSSFPTLRVPGDRDL